MTPLPTPRGGDRKVLAELTATVIVEIPAGEADDEITCPDCEECGIFTLHDDGACPSVRCQNCQHRIGVIVLERKQETRNVSETTSPAADQSAVSRKPRL